MGPRVLSFWRISEIQRCLTCDHEMNKIFKPQVTSETQQNVIKVRSPGDTSGTRDTLSMLSKFYQLFQRFALFKHKRWPMRKTHTDKHPPIKTIHTRVLTHAQHTRTVAHKHTRKLAHTHNTHTHTHGRPRIHATHVHVPTHNLNINTAGDAQTVIRENMT